MDVSCVGSGNPTKNNSLGMVTRTERPKLSSTTPLIKPTVRKRPQYIHGRTDHDIIHDVQCAILDVVISKCGYCEIDTIIDEIKIRPDQKMFLRQALHELCHKGGFRKPRLVCFIKNGRRGYMLNPALPIPDTSRRNSNHLVSSPPPKPVPIPAYERQGVQP